jgi:hypothetical protein
VRRASWRDPAERATRAWRRLGSWRAAIIVAVFAAGAFAADWLTGSHDQTVGLPRAAPPGEPSNAERSGPSPLGLASGPWQDREQVRLEARVAAYLRVLAAVDDADVIIIRPPETPFLDEQQPVTASAILRLAPGATLTGAQLVTIAAGVAAHVPGLDAADVTLTSDRGDVLFQRGTATVAVARGATPANARRAATPPPPPSRAPLAVLVGAVVIALAGSGALLVRRRGHEETALAPRSGLASLADLPARRVAELLADERPALAAAALLALPERHRRAVARALPPQLRAEVGQVLVAEDADRSEPSVRALEAAAAALRRKAEARARLGPSLAGLLATAAEDRSRANHQADGVRGPHL